MLVKSYANCSKNQIDQFIETLFPSQESKQLHAEQKKRDEPSMDTTEALMLIGAVMLVLLSIGALMVVTLFLLSDAELSSNNGLITYAPPDRDRLVLGRSF